MRRRTLLVVLVGLAVVVAVGAVVLWPQPPSRITRENFARIKEGMSRAEVEAILGPPGDYRTRLGESQMNFDQSWNPDLVDYGPAVATWQPATDLDTGRRANFSGAFWISDSMRIDILSDDESGRVYHPEAYARRSAGTLDNLLWRLKRQWRRWFP
jgi:hypothetical protein